MAAKIAEKNDHLYPNLKSKGKIASIISIFIRKKFYQASQEKALFDKLWANDNI